VLYYGDALEAAPVRAFGNVDGGEAANKPNEHRRQHFCPRDWHLSKIKTNAD
jgi:hypothetical protein